MVEGEGGSRYDMHGRRLGRPLRAGRRDLVETLLPAIAITPEQAVDPPALFPERVDDVWLEIGFGGGEHLAWQAAENPAIGFIGCEPFINGVANLLVQVEAAGLRNVRILPDDARPLLDRLPPASIGRAFVLFPDPWPKVRHHKRRIVRPPVLDALAHAMRDGAELRIATDDVAYLRAILEAVLAHPAFAWRARGPEDWRSRPDDWPETRYERKALVQGRRSTYLRFARVPRAAVAAAGKA